MAIRLHFRPQIQAALQRRTIFMDCQGVIAKDAKIYPNLRSDGGELHGIKLTSGRLRPKRYTMSINRQGKAFAKMCEKFGVEGQVNTYTVIE